MKRVWLSVSFFILPGFFSLFAQELTRMESQQVAQSSDSSTGAAFNNSGMLAAYGADRYIVWSHNDYVMLAVSRDDGQSWGSPRLIYRGIRLALPTVAVNSSGTICLGWLEMNSGPRSARAMISKDNGLSWSPPQSISNDGEVGGLCLIGAENGIFHASWHMTNGNTTHIMFSIFNGEIWTTPVQIDNSNSQAMWSSLAATGDTLYAVYRDNTTGKYRVYLSRSTNAGKDWEIPRNIVSSDNSYDPTVAATKSGHVVVAYQQFMQIKAFRSTDFGETFGSPVTISPQGVFARVVNNENGFFGIVFEMLFDRSRGTKDLANKQTGFAYSTDFGQTFSPAEALEEFGGGKFGNATMTAPNQVTACWLQINCPTVSIMVKQGTLEKTTGIIRSHDVPLSYALTSFPNPVRLAANNLTATIRFTIPNQQHLQISLFDVLGREVIKIADEFGQRGDHSVLLHVGGLSNGLYFIRLHTSQVSLQKKILLIR